MTAINLPHPQNPQGKAIKNTKGARVAAYLHNAGFGADVLAIAVAIAYAESGLNFSAVSKTDDYGLMQINKAAHPDLMTDAVMSSKAWANPLTNAKMAFSVYKSAGSSFKPWSTYTSGSYKSHLAQAKADVATLQANGADWERTTVSQVKTDIGSNNVDNTINNAKDSLAGPFNALTQAITNAMSNAVVVIIAVVFLVLGVVILLRRQVGSAALNATPTGRVVKAGTELASPNGSQPWKNLPVT